MKLEVLKPQEILNSGQVPFQFSDVGILQQQQEIASPIIYVHTSL